MSWLGPSCLLFTGLFAWILGLTSIGLWVGCYFECPTGRDTDFNYYVAVWTGVVAFFTGILHMVFCCGHRTQYEKPVLWSAAICSFILLPCTLLLTTLSGYLSWREWDTEQKYQEALEDPNDDLVPEKLQGDYVTGVALFACMAVVGLFLLALTCIFNCYHCCGNSRGDEEEVEVPIEPLPHEENPRGRGRTNDGYYRDRGYAPQPAPQYTRGAGYRDPGYSNRQNGDYYRHDRGGYRPQPAPAAYSQQQQAREPPRDRQPTYRDPPRRPYTDYAAAPRRENYPSSRDQMRWESRENRSENLFPWDDNFHIGSHHANQDSHRPADPRRSTRPTSSNYY